MFDRILNMPLQATIFDMYFLVGYVVIVPKSCFYCIRGNAWSTSKKCLYEIQFTTQTKFQLLRIHLKKIWRNLSTKHLKLSRKKWQD